MDKKPLYKITIDPAHGNGEKLGIDMVAYTPNPAIIVKGVAFNKANPMKFTDVLKGRVAAPVLIPDMAIPRIDNDGKEYDVIFTKEVIEQLYEDFMLNKGKAVFNLDHVSNDVAPSFVLESWITVAPEHDKSFTKYGVKVPEGSLFFVSQFTDLDYFKREIIEKDRAAYSIEGFLGMTLSKLNNKLNKMSEQKFVSATTSEGVVVSADSEVFAEGVEVYTTNEAGVKGDVPNGEHTLENGVVITVEGNKIVSLVEPMDEELDSETVAVIQKAIEPALAKMQAEFENKLAALKVELSNQPAGEAPKKNESAPIQLSAVGKVKQLITKKSK